MSDLLPFIVLGLATGSVYALGGVGLVLTYKTSGIFNFGYGAIATTAAYSFFALHVDHGVGWPVAAFLTVVVLGILMGCAFEPFARLMSSKGLAMQVCATVGLLLVVQAFFTLKYGQATRTFPQFLPTDTFKVAGTYVTVAQAVTVGVVLLLTTSLYVFFRRARLGIAMRGVVDNPDLLDLAGTNPRRVRRLAWMVGCVFAALAGVLLGPSVSLDANTLSLLIVQTFGAAAIGGFASLPRTYAGGLGIGVAASVLSYYLNSQSPIVAGIPASMPFIVLFGVLLVGSRRWLSASQPIVPTAARWSAPLRVQLFTGAVAVVFLATVPAFAGARLSAWTAVLAFAILFLSLGLLVRTAGLVSLCQLSFAAIGAAAFSHFAADFGIPWGVSLVLAGLVAVPVGALLAIPAVRLGGLYLALATLGFGVVLRDMFYRSELMFGVTADEPRPFLSWLRLDSDRGYYYVVLAVLVICTVATVALIRTRLGRLLRAMADSHVAVTTNGTSVAVARVLVFAISAFLAAIAGVLFSVSNSVATGDEYDPITSLTLIALILITFGGVPWYAILAAAGYMLVPAYVEGANTANYLQIVFGLSALSVSMNGIPQSPAWLVSAVDRLGGAKRRRAVTPAATTSRVSAGALELDDLHVHFGGVVAVDGLTLAVPTGKITGLIGPNGAGKTTTFNLASGLLRPTSGHVLIDGHRITSRSPAARARLGLGRTFQKMQLFESLTVAENVAIGREAWLAGGSPLRQVFSRPGDRRVIDGAVAEALELCGIGELAEANAAGLSTGQRRLVELARCLAGPFRFLLLDEPSSGLDRAETAEFGRILQRVVAQRGVGILLVEHDMALVMEVCDHVHVLDFGVPIATGTPAEIRRSPVVQAAYLGEEDEALAASDSARTSER